MTTTASPTAANTPLSRALVPRSPGAPHCRVPPPQRAAGTPRRALLSILQLKILDGRLQLLGRDLEELPAGLRGHLLHRRAHPVHGLAAPPQTGARRPA